MPFTVNDLEPGDLIVPTLWYQRQLPDKMRTHAIYLGVFENPARLSLDIVARMHFNILIGNRIWSLWHPIHLYPTTFDANRWKKYFRKVAD